VITESVILVLISQQTILLLNLHSQYSSVYETMPLLTCNFHASTCQCAMYVALAQLVTCANFLANVTCASDFRKKLSDVS